MTILMALVTGGLAEHLDTVTHEDGRTYYHWVASYTDFGTIGELVLAGDIITGIKCDTRPRAIGLSGNFPNPFNPSTTFGFELPEATYVRLTVYSLTGQLVATLVSGTVSAGAHEAVWTPENVSSGIYLAVFEAGGKQLVQRMTLLK